MEKVFTVHSVHPVRSVYCGWHLLWEKCLLCTVFILLENVYCGWCVSREKCLLYTVLIMLENVTLGGVYCGKSVYYAQWSSC